MLYNTLLVRVDKILDEKSNIILMDHIGSQLSKFIKWQFMTSLLSESPALTSKRGVSCPVGPVAIL